MAYVLRVRRVTLQYASLSCLAAFLVVALAVAHGHTPDLVEKPVIDWLAPNPTGGWARVTTLLGKPAIGTALVAALIFGGLRGAVRWVVVYAALAGVAFLLGEHVVKPLVDRTYYDEVTFPSGNVTAVCATTLALWLALWPALGRTARRVTATIGVAWVLMMSLAVVGAEWHTPLDDVGSVLLSVGVVAGGATMLESLVARWSPRRGASDTAGHRARESG